MYIKNIIIRHIKKNIFIKNKLKLLEPILGHMPNFIIVSTGRAGSQFIAQYLSSIGIPCAHEGFFNTKGFRKRFFYKGESSWMALPYLEKNIKINNAIVLHQVRNPLDVINSYSGISLFIDTNNPYYNFINNHFILTGNELIDCMRWWSEWNIRCQNIAHLTYKVESIDQSIHNILKTINIRHSNNYIYELNKFIYQNINSRTRNNLTLHDLPDGKVKQNVINLARKYKYNI